MEAGRAKFVYVRDTREVTEEASPEPKLTYADEEIAADVDRLSKA